MSYVYKETERWQDKGYTHILWTVGYYDGSEWKPESDHNVREEAAARTHYLNGGNDAELLTALEMIYKEIQGECDPTKAQLFQIKSAINKAKAK